jgi:hypothetical protein
MTDEVHTRVNGNEPAGTDPAIDHPVGEACGEQLRAQDDALLPTGQIGENRVEFLR